MSPPKKSIIPQKDLNTSEADEISNNELKRTMTKNDQRNQRGHI
jgi:hypothetical protein